MVSQVGWSRYGGFTPKGLAALSRSGRATCALHSVQAAVAGLGRTACAPCWWWWKCTTQQSAVKSHSTDASSRWNNTAGASQWKNQQRIEFQWKIFTASVRRTRVSSQDRKQSSAQCCIWRGTLDDIWQTKVDQDRLPTQLTVLLISDTCWQLLAASACRCLRQADQRCHHLPVSQILEYYQLPNKFV